MALTDTQKQSILMYLGYPAKSLLSDSTHFSSVVDSRLKNLSAEIETGVVSTLTRLAALETRLDSAACRLSAAKVDEIELNPKEIEGLRSERKRLIRILADYIDLPIRSKGGNMVGVCV